MFKKLGKELGMNFGYDNGEIKLTMSHTGTLGWLSASAGLSVAMLVDKLTDLTPWDWDDALLDDMAKNFLAKKKV